jgi:type II secretory pathway pseudopilin PulG
MMTRRRATSGTQRRAGITLVELLVTMTIMSLVVAMLIVIWIALGDSFTNTAQGSNARDYARLAASRMGRELRDAEAQLTTGRYTGLPAVLWASANKIIFVTTFNDSGNDLPNAKPLAIMYYLESGTLYMKRDTNDDGQWDAAKPTSLVPYMVNGSVGSGGGTPVFSYTCVADDGSYTAVRPSGDLTSLPEAQRDRIISVTFTLLVDENPKRPPTHTTVVSTAQLRNQRWF